MRILILAALLGALLLSPQAYAFLLFGAGGGGPAPPSCGSLTLNLGNACDAICAGGDDMMIINRILASAALVALTSASAMAGSTTYPVTVELVTNFDAVTDGSGNLGSKIAVCDGSALANCAAVKAPATAPLATDPATVVAISPNGFPVDQATFTPGTSPGSLINCEYQSTFTSNPIGTGHQGTVGCNNYRGVFANLMNSSGSEIGIVASPLYIAAPPSSSAAVAITPVSSTTAESSHILKGSAGNLYSVYVTTGATLGYLMAFNATSAPADGAVTPVDCIPVAANSTASLASNGAPPTAFSIGITVVFSSTGCFTKTASATAFFRGAVQ